MRVAVVSESKSLGRDRATPFVRLSPHTRRLSQHMNLKCQPYFVVIAAVMLLVNACQSGHTTPTQLRTEAEPTAASTGVFGAADEQLKAHPDVTESLHALRNTAGVLRARAVTVRATKLKQAALDGASTKVGARTVVFNLFPDTDVHATFAEVDSRHASNEQTNVSLEARLPEMTGAWSIFTFSRETGNLDGRISMPERLYLINHLKAGIHYIREIDTAVAGGLNFDTLQNPDPGLLEMRSSSRDFVRDRR